MKKARFLFNLASGGMLLVAQANAQPSPVAPIAPGTPVRDTSGSDVGTVQSVAGQMLIVKTDRHEVQLPISSFTRDGNALLFSMTREQLNAQAESALAKAAAQIVPGAQLRGSAGTVVGTIDAIDEEFVTVRLSEGKLVRLPRSAVGPGPNGPVLGLTAKQFDEAVAGLGG